jgi:hypothetical protein
MPAVSLLTSPVFRAFTAAGAPLAAGRLYSYLAQTSTPQALYADANGTTPLANPIVLDSGGACVAYLPQGIALKLNLLDSALVQQPDWPVDNLLAFLPSGPNQALPAGMGLATAQGTFTALDGAASRTLPGFLLANVLILAVTLNVTVPFGTGHGLATLALGTPDLIDRYGSALTRTTGTKPLRQGGIPLFTVATDLVLSSEGGTMDAIGTAIATLYYATFA